jgi:hypothetical protein
MTVKIHTLNATVRRCYNTDAVEAALERAISKRKNPAPKLVRQDELIRELAKLRDAEQEAEIWISHSMGTAAEFLASLGARARRLHNLFGGRPIR